ncbi:hypothetical protein CTI12_AA311470 [Artemisia annua]|uniref:LRAT domain-containing protein n=1 Tax=Artemisia annua TaxID=35608 RepID=A0A2U1N326_ARTAN|nr:hypothetical protein CTI12_AA311470 [Artemisia annua]
MVLVRIQFYESYVWWTQIEKGVWPFSVIWNYVGAKTQNLEVKGISHRIDSLPDAAVHDIVLGGFRAVTSLGSIFVKCRLTSCVLSASWTMLAEQSLYHVFIKSLATCNEQNKAFGIIDSLPDAAVHDIVLGGFRAVTSLGSIFVKCRLTSCVLFSSRTMLNTLIISAACKMDSLDTIFPPITSQISHFVSHPVDESEIVEGDHIYIWLNSNKSSFMLDKTPLNTGIYIGGPSKLVIHVTAAGKDISGKFPRKPPKSCSTDGCGNMGEKSSVFQTCLSCFREGSPVYRYQYGVGKFEHMFKLRGGTCTMAVSDPPKEVVRRAQVLLEAGFGKYDLIDNNCEDFGLYCKTGLMVRGGDNKPIIGTSGQGNSWFRASLRAFLIASGAVTLLITPYALDIGGVRVVADRLIGTSDKWKGIFGTTFTSFSAVAGLTFIKLRHDYDIGVRSDAEKVRVDEFIELLGRKRSSHKSPAKNNCNQEGEMTNKAPVPAPESQPSS